jgi:hypothetical protein
MNLEHLAAAAMDYRAVLERLAHRFRNVPDNPAQPWLREIREVLK